MNGHTVGPTDPKLGTDDNLDPGKDIGGWRSASEAGVGGREAENGRGTTVAPRRRHFNEKSY